MSKLTPCCYCVLRDLRRQAAEEGKVCTERPGTELVCGEYGLNVLIHNADEEPDDEKHFAAWLMKVTDHCVC